MRRFSICIAAAALLASSTATAQGIPKSTDGTDPKAWDPNLDAVKAAAKNHRVIYEDEDVRVLSVTVEPGEVEVAHHHQWPSVIVFVSLTPSENRDAKGNLLPTTRPGETREQPVVVRMPPQGAHAVTNKGTSAMRLIRIEYKKGFPEQP